MKFIIGETEAAIETTESWSSGVLEIDYEKQYMTKYGFFFPIHTRATILIRVLRGEVKMRDIIGEGGSINVSGVLIDHLGKVYRVFFNSADNTIVYSQHTKGFLCQEGSFRDLSLGENTEVMSLLMKDCESVEHAVKRYNSVVPRQAIDYVIVSIEDLAKRLKETGNTKILSLSEFNNLPEDTPPVEAPELAKA